MPTATKERPTDKLSMAQVAELLGCTQGRVSQLLIAGEMKGEKYRGIYWEIERREAMRFLKAAATGRPRVGRRKNRR